MPPLSPLTHEVRGDPEYPKVYRRLAPIYSPARGDLQGFSPIFRPQADPLTQQPNILQHMGTCGFVQPAHQVVADVKQLLLECSAAYAHI